MDCQAAREILEWPDLERPEAPTAWAHVRQCGDCSTLFDSRDRFDDRLSAALRDVAVPHGLRDRLLSGIASSSVTTGTMRPAKKSAGRRRSLRIAACVCSLAIAAALWQYSAWRSRPQPFDLGQLRAVAAQLLQKAGDHINLQALPTFDNAFDLAGLQEWAASADLRGVEIDGRRRWSDAAASIVQIGRGKDAIGILLIVPAARITDASVLAPRADVSYAPVANAVWKSGDFVFVCVTTHDHLDDLMRFAPGRTGAA